MDYIMKLSYYSLGAALNPLGQVKTVIWIVYTLKGIPLHTS